MKVKVDEQGDLVLSELFNGAVIETSNGNAIGICLRDDTVEINILPVGYTKHSWWRVNMEECTIEHLEDHDVE